MIVKLAIESPRQDAIIKMFANLDKYLSELYPPESNHFVDVAKLSSSDAIFCVARYNDTAIGCGAARLQFDQEEAYAEIKRMYVQEEYRGEGVGGQILRFLHLKIASQGINLARLEVGYSQSNAIKLYENIGYYRIPPFGEYDLDPLSLFFEKEIATP